MRENRKIELKLLHFISEIERREMRKLWIARINAAARMNNISYSKLMYGLKLAGIEINRKMLSEIAICDPKAFSEIVEKAKAAIK